MNRRLGRTIVRAIVVLAVAAPAAPAATIKVTTTADTLATGSGCSLRAAVIATNTDAVAGGCKAGSGADVIKLAKDATYAFAIGGPFEEGSAAGDLNVVGPLTIKGNGATIDADGLGRVLEVRSGGSLKLSDATLTGGAPTADSVGGALMNRGTAVLSHVDVVDNGMSSQGGEVENHGTLTISDSTIARDVIQGYLIEGELVVTLENAGTLVLRRTVVQNGIVVLLNDAHAVASVSDSQLGFGQIGISNQGSLHLARSTVSGNTGDYVLYSAPGINNGGELWLTDSTVSDNTATTQYWAYASSWSGFPGGGLSNEGTAHVSGSTITRNALIKDCFSFYLGGGCDLSAGAGIGNAGMMDVANTTVSGNRIEYACTRDDDPDAPPCPVDSGAGIANLSGSLVGVGLTVADNHGAVAGGGVAVLGGSVSLTDSIVADNTADSGNDCSGTLGVFAYSLLRDAAGCAITAGAGSLFGLDPLLGPLADNGGFTQTMALDPASPAVDAGPTKRRLGCPSRDERGVKRPQGARCDMGAYELSAN
jgi:CSLREA domain-containing protein